MKREVDWDRIAVDLDRIRRICQRVAEPWGGLDGEALVSDVLIELAERPPSECISDDVIARMASRYAYQWAGWL